MSPQFVLQFIRHVKNRGSVLPFVMGVGLMMSLVTATMMFRSSNDQIHASSQAQTAESLAAAEAAIARTVDLFNEYPDLLNKESADWDIAVDTSKLTCDLENDTSEVPTDKAALIENANGGSPGWIELEQTDTSISEFRIVNFDPETGLLKVEGRKKANNGSGSDIPDLPGGEEPDGGGGGSDPSVQANSILEVKIVQQSPGIWVASDDGSGIPPFERKSPEEVSSPYLDRDRMNAAGKINGNIWVEGCSYDENEIGEDVFVHDGDQIRPLYNGATPNATGSLETRPSLPVPPPEAYRLPPLHVNYCYITLPRISRNRPNTNCADINSPDEDVMEGKFGEHTSFPDMTIAEQVALFNRTDDRPINGVYHYVIKNLKAESLEDTSSEPPPPNSTGLRLNRALNINNGQIYIEPPAGFKVALYVEGDIRVSSEGLLFMEPTALDPTATVPTCEGTLQNSPQSLSIASYLGPRDYTSDKLEVYLADGSGIWGSDFRANVIEMSYRSMISGFVYGPSVHTQVAGGEVRGAIWSQKFESHPNRSGNVPYAGTCNIALTQQDVGDNFLVEIPKRLSGIVAWRRQSQ